MGADGDIGAGLGGGGGAGDAGFGGSGFCGAGGLAVRSFVAGFFVFILTSKNIYQYDFVVKMNIRKYLLFYLKIKTGITVLIKYLFYLKFLSVEEFLKKRMRLRIKRWGMEWLCEKMKDQNWC